MRKSPVIVGVLLICLCCLIWLWWRWNRPRFTLVIENDSFGTFQPINNQIRAQEDPDSYRGGVLFQTSDFSTSPGHTYDWLKLDVDMDDTSWTQIIGRGADAARWIDIECGEATSSTEPWPHEQASLLLPNTTNADPGDDNDHRLHTEMIPDSVVAVTLWGPEAGLTIRTEPFTLAGHGHTRYILTSREPCAVRVWTDLGAATPSVVYGTGEGRIARIVVGEDDPGTQHGGLHSPPWDI